MQNKKRERSRKKVRRRFKPLIYLVIIGFGILGIINIHSYFNPKPKIQDNCIIRYHKELLRILEEEPEYKIGDKFEINLPKEIQEDIQMVIDSKGTLKAEYYLDTNSKVMLEISFHNNELYIFLSSLLYIMDENCTYNFSLYKNNKNIIVYGNPVNESKQERYEFDHSTGEYVTKELETNQRFIDLYGTDILIDDIMIGKDISLVLKGKEYKFYRNGEQVGNTVIYPGKKTPQRIVNYVLDENTKNSELCFR